MDDRPEQMAGSEAESVHDGLLVYSPRPQALHHLNRTAAMVWVLCDGTGTADEIAEEVGNAFGMESAPIETVLQCLDDLRAKGLIS